MKRRHEHSNPPPEQWVKIYDLYPLMRESIVDVNIVMDRLKQQDMALFSPDGQYVARDTVQQLLDTRALQLCDTVFDIRLSRYSEGQVPVRLDKNDKPIIAFLAAHGLHDPDGRFEGKTRQAAERKAARADHAR